MKLIRLIPLILLALVCSGCGSTRWSAASLDLDVVFLKQRTSDDSVILTATSPISFEVNVNEPSRYSERRLWLDVEGKEGKLRPVFDDILLPPNVPKSPKRKDGLAGLIELPTDPLGRKFIALSHARESGRVVPEFGAYRARLCINYANARKRVIAVAESKMFVLIIKP